MYTEEFFKKSYGGPNSYGDTYGEHREFLEFSESEFLSLKNYAESLNVDFLCTAFDNESVDFLERIGVNSYKIASGDLTNLELIEKIAKLNKYIFLSTGASTLEEIKKAYDLVSKYHKNLCLLHCVASYPTNVEDMNLNAITTLKEEFPDISIGYSSHDLGIEGSLYANLLGAEVIEKHFTFDKSAKGSDHKLSLLPQELKELSNELKNIQKMLVNGSKILNEYELDARVKMGKSIYAKRPIKKGEVITKNLLTLKTPGGGIPSYDIENILNTEVTEDINKEEMIDYNKLKVAEKS